MFNKNDITELNITDITDEGNGVGKAGYRHKGACAGMLCYIVEYPEPCEQRRKHYQRAGRRK